MLQPFSAEGALLCASPACGTEIDSLYIVIRLRDPVDTDAELAVHIGCLADFHGVRGAQR